MTDQQRPLDGVRILALEQMQALPWGTQLLARLGADVVKVEHPVVGESARGALPAMTDPAGRAVGATFLRNNLNKRSIGIDLKTERGRDLVLRLAPRFDVVAENFKPGVLDRAGLDYASVAAVHPAVVYLSVSGFGHDERSPYRSWPAYAPIAEAMSGIYEYKRAERGPDEPPTVSPVGGLGDIGSAAFGVIGALAALRHRDRTGRGQHVDISMLDSMVAMTDMVTNMWSMGVRPEAGSHPPMIIDGFRASDGWFVVFVGRAHQFPKLAETVGRPEWLDDDRLASPPGWAAHLDDVIRPGIEAWAAGLTKGEACDALARAGVAAGPCMSADDVVTDPHIVARGMVVGMARTDGVEAPVAVPGNPVKLSDVPERPDQRVPWLGEHTDAVLRDELGIEDEERMALREQGVIG